MVLITYEVTTRPIKARFESRAEKVTMDEVCVDEDKQVSCRFVCYRVDRHLISMLRSLIAGINPYR